MTDPAITEALRVIGTYLKGQPVVPFPSISMPLADWEAAQAEIASLKAQNATLLRQWSDNLRNKT